MADPREPQPKDLSPEQVRLLPFYHDLRNEIVEPDRVVVSSQYFWTRWAPLLGPTLTALVVTLRRHCYYNKVTKERRDWCFPEQATLAREIGVDSTKTIRAALAHPLAHYFIRRQARYVYDPERRKKIRTSDMYFVAMDDPLTPEDEQLLCIRAAERLIAEGRGAEAITQSALPTGIQRDDPTLGRESDDADDDRGDGHAVPPTATDETLRRPDGDFYPQVEASEGSFFPQDSAVNSAPEELPLNSTFYTTTTTTEGDTFAPALTGQRASKALPGSHSSADRSRRPIPGDPNRGVALDAYVAANSRPASPAEIQQLAELAAHYASAAYHQGATGWGWVHDAIAEAVAAGSAFVAPRRIERILHRWATQGRTSPGATTEAAPASSAPNRGRGRPSPKPARPRAQMPVAASERDVAADEPLAGASVEAVEAMGAPSSTTPRPDDETAPRGRSPRSQRPKARRPQFVVDPSTGLTNGQCWALVLDELARVVSPAAFQAWLKPTALLACEANGVLVVGAPSSTHAAWLEDRLRADIEMAVRRVLGRSAALEFVAEPAWRAALSEEKG